MVYASHTDEVHTRLLEKQARGVKTEVVPYKLDEEVTIDALRLQKALRWTGSRSVTLYRQTGSGS
ncbi:hypothetical protein, partial [Faecalibaculum rodentium]|uniref:hypothetical protein n=1 Tax=Faecalibaculum rodentium TaxID=1702221 RepID=UPI0025A9D890